jgi:hypothetical protein
MLSNLYPLNDCDDLRRLQVRYSAEAIKFVDEEPAGRNLPQNALKNKHRQVSPVIWLVWYCAIKLGKSYLTPY